MAQVPHDAMAVSRVVAAPCRFRCAGNRRARRGHGRTHGARATGRSPATGERAHAAANRAQHAGDLDRAAHAGRPAKRADANAAQPPAVPPCAKQRLARFRGAGTASRHCANLRHERVHRPRTRSLRARDASFAAVAARSGGAYQRLLHAGDDARRLRGRPAQRLPRRPFRDRRLGEGANARRHGFGTGLRTHPARLLSRSPRGARSLPRWE